MWAPNFIYLFIFMILPHKLKSFKKIKEENYIRMIEYKRGEQPISASLSLSVSRKKKPPEKDLISTHSSLPIIINRNHHPKQKSSTLKIPFPKNKKSVLLKIIPHFSC